MARSATGPPPHKLDKLKQLMERVGDPEERMEKLLTVAGQNTDTHANLLDIYERRVAQLASKDVFYPYERLDGEFPIGHDPDGQRIALTRNQLNRHVLLVGMTGSGKTTFFYNLMDQLPVPFWAFDIKQDYRHLHTTGRDLLVLPWTELKFNPLRPPAGVSPHRWAQVFSEIFGHANDLLAASKNYITARLIRLYRMYDLIDEEVAEPYPSLYELNLLVERDKINYVRKRAQYRDTDLNRLEMMTLAGGSIFACSSGYPIEDLLERNVVFEFDGLRTDLQNFLMEILFAYVYEYRLARNERDTGLRHVFFLDEGKQVFSVYKERKDAAGIPAIDELTAKMREFGEGLVVADQEATKLTDSIKANTNVKLWLPLGSGKDIAEMARTFGIHGEAVDFTRTMDRGEGLLYVAGRDPVPVILPDFPLDKRVTDDELRRRLKTDLEGLTHTERVRTEAFEQAVGEDRSDEDGEPKSGVEVAAEALLASVNEQPLLGLSKRYQKIAVDTKKGTKAKNELLTLGLVKEVEVNTHTRGRNPKLLELTNEGRKVLRERGHEVKAGAKGGLEHRWWQRKIKAHYEADGYDVTVEYQLGKKAIDVYAVRADEAIAIELALSPDHEVENVKKCLAHGPDRVEIVYTDADVKEAIEGNLRSELGGIPDRVSFSPVTAYT